MQKKVNLLRMLQEIDLRIDGHKGDKELLFGEVSDLEGKVEEARLALAAKSDSLANLEAEKSALEENMAAEGENITRSEARLKEIQTQKEYQAVSKEITAAKKMKGELEEQVLQKIGQIDELKGEIASGEENLAALEGNCGVRKGEAQAKIGELDAGIAGVMVEREAILKDIPASYLNRYKKLREKRQGLAVVEAKAGSCLGCNMNLPPQLFNNLYKLTEFISCPHCQRLLYLRQEENK